jgi:hypothetical protein
MFFRWWTADRVEALRVRWFNEETLDQIAAGLSAEFGEVVSRSKVSGAASRYGMPSREVPKAFRAAVEARRLSDGRKRAKGPFALPGSPDAVMRGEGCRWIYGDDLVRPKYCGETGSPWCPTHRARIYVGKPPKATGKNFDVSLK